MDRRNLTAIWHWRRRYPPNRLPVTSSPGSFAPPVARKPVRRRSAAAAVARRVPTARVAALFAEMITPGGGSAPALLVHRLGASFPRSGILEPWPSSRRPRSAAHIEPPAPPEPTAYLWPNDRRRKRSRPEARRVRRPLGLAWYQPLPPARLRPPARRRPAAANTRLTVRRLPPRLAAFLPPPPLPMALFVRQRPPRRQPARSRPRTGERLAALRLCHDPSMAAGMFFRDGPAAASFIHNTTSGAAVQQGSAAFARRGPASAAAWFRSRC